MPIVTRRGIQAGGAIQTSRSIYVERSADRRLEAALLEAKYSLVLAPRQVGKSSLRVRVSERIRARGVISAVVDLSAIGVASCADEWYYSIAYEIGDALGLGPALADFWADKAGQGTASRRFMRSIERVILGQVDTPLVVFIDEVDMTLSQPFRHEDFFAVIRAMFNARADQPEWRSITICLLGVMTRGDMATEALRTPFNIDCVELVLDDFSRAELGTFEPCLRDLYPDPERILDEVYAWTRGHPALSQRVLAALAAELRPVDEPTRVVDALITELYLDPGASGDPVLADTARRFGRANSGELHVKMIETYGRVLGGERVLAAAEQLGPMGAQTISQLQLAGLVRRDRDGVLYCRNRIVKQLFDEQWLRSVQADRLLSEDLNRWLDHGCRGVFLLEGERLQIALDWARPRHDLSKDEREFLFASEEQAKLRSERQAQRRRRQSIVLAGLSLGLLIALAVALIMFGRYRREQGEVWRHARAAARSATEAENQRDNARAEALEARDSAARSAGHLATLRANQPGREQEALVEGTRAVAMYFEASLTSLSGELGAVASISQRIQSTAHILAGTPVDDPPPEAIEGLWTGLSRARSSTELVGVQAPYALSDDGARIVSQSGDDVVLRELHGLTPVCIIPERRAQSLYLSDRWFVVRTETSTEIFDDTCVRRGVLRHSPFEGEADGHPDVVAVSESQDLLVSAAFFGLVTWDIDPEGRPSLRQDLRHRRHYQTRVQAHEGIDNFASVSGIERQAVVWDVRSGKKLQTFEDGEVMRFVQLSRDGRVLVAAGGHRAQAWDLDTGAPLATLLHDRDISALVMSADGGEVVVATGELISIWNPSTGAMIANLQGHSDPVGSFALSPDGTQLASASADGTARLWDMTTFTPVAVLRGHDGTVRSVQFTPDGVSLITTAEDEAVRLWDTTSGEPALALRGHSKPVRASAACDDNQQLATGDLRGHVQLWDATKGARLGPGLEHDRAVVDLAFGGPDCRLASATGGGVVQLWDTSDPAKPHLLARSAERGGHAVTSLAFAPKGKLVAVAGGSRQVELLDGRTLDLVAALPYGAVIADLAFSIDGRYLAIVGWDRRLAVWDLEHRSQVAQTAPGRYRWLAVAWSRDARHLAVGGDGGRLAVWDFDEGGSDLSMRWHQELETPNVRAVVFTPDMREIVSADSSGRLIFWRADDGARTRENGEHRGGLWTLAMSGTQHILSAGDDLVPRVWRWRLSDLLQASCDNMARSGDQTLDYCAKLSQISGWVRAFHKAQGPGDDREE